jgi:hypothetical protein
LETLFENVAFLISTTAEESNNFDFEKYYFLTGLDTPNTPSNYERVF